MGNYYTDAYSNCPLDQNPFEWSDAPYTKCERCYNRKRDGNLCETCELNWGKEGATIEGCAGCAYFREPFSCKNPEHVCTLPPDKRKTFKLPRTNNWKLFSMFVRTFSTAEIKNEAREDGTIDAFADFGWAKTWYSDFCKDPQAEWERVIEELQKRYMEQIKILRKNMLDMLRDNGVEVRDG